MAKTPPLMPAPNEAPKAKRLAFSGPELMFREELAKLGAKVDSYIYRPQQEWADVVYGFRITRADGSVETGAMPWDLNTFSRIIELAKEGASS